MIKSIFKNMIAVSVAITFSVYADTTVSAANCKTLLNTNPSNITAADQATLKECIKQSKCSDEKLAGIPDCAQQLSKLYAASAVNQATQAANAVAPAAAPLGSSTPAASGSTTPENAAKPVEKDNATPASILPPSTVAGMGVKKSPEEDGDTQKTDTKNKTPKDNINWL